MYLQAARLNSGRERPGFEASQNLPWSCGRECESIAGKKKHENIGASSNLKHEETPEMKVMLVTGSLARPHTHACVSL